MADLSKAGTIEIEGDKEIRYDEHGNRHIRMKADAGNYAAELGLPTVKSGPCLVTHANGEVQACRGAAFAAPVQILEESEYFLRLRLRQASEFVEIKCMFATYAERVRVAEQLRRVLGAT